MKIHAADIPDEGLKLKAKFDFHDPAMEVDSKAEIFIRSVDVTADIKKAGKEVFVDVALEGPCEYTCSRCLSKFQGVFKKNFNVNYEVEPDEAIEIDEDIRQEIILSYPMKVLCKPDCKGICLNCGQNLNVVKCECDIKK